jgi:uncharacterized protein (DUF1015 family)
MATIKPFRGLRPLPELAAEIASLPYDVLDTEEARQEVARHPLSFLTVTKSEATLPPGTDPYSQTVYDKARENLQAYVTTGRMKQDPEPCYYIYRQMMDGHIQIGVTACVPVAEYNAGIVKRHELTRAEKEQDRVRHIETTKAQTGPVFLTYRSRPEIEAYVLQLMGEREPDVKFRAGDGVSHMLYVIDNPLEVRELTRLFTAVPAFYIADGHHRCAGAARVAEDMERTDRGVYPIDEMPEYEYFQAVIFPDRMLHIIDYNRVVRDLAGHTKDEFLQALEDSFEVLPQEQPVKPAARHSFGMYLEGAWYLLRAKEGTFDSSDRIAALDVSILQQNVLGPLLRIGDPRTDKRIDFVGGIRGLGELAKRVDDGGWAVAFSLYPTSMNEVMDVADAGLIMPPKSTWFEPKLRDGIVVHLI